MTSHVTPKPAATLVLWSPQSEVFLLKRQSKSGFLAGAHVFPGGAVDESDLELAAWLPDHFRGAAAAALDGADNALTALAYFIAAIRETAEECGFVLARQESGKAASDASLALVAEGLVAQKPFNQLLKEQGLVPDVQSLISIAWWVTPTIEKRRYDTRFFMAPLPANQNVRVNLSESSSGCFLSPKRALHDYYEGHIHFAPPTIAILEQLSVLDSAHDLPKLFPRPIEAICPEALSDGDGNLVLVLPGDPLHTRPQTLTPVQRTRFALGENGRFV
jgi:8-oxo-dGTP pyrophosphatase MutT (NUDIX family)